MSDYDTREERAALEAELESLPEETVDTSNVSTVVSVRLRGDELAAIEAAAGRAGLRLGTFIRQAALATAVEGRAPVDQRRVDAAVAELTKDLALLVAMAGGNPLRVPTLKPSDFDADQFGRAS